MFKKNPHFLMFFFVLLFISFFDAIIEESLPITGIVHKIFFHLIEMTVLIFLYKKLEDKKTIEKDLSVRSEAEALSLKVTMNISQNIDHQLRSPLIAIKNSFEEIESFIKTMILFAKPGGNRNIDKFIYGCNNKDETLCKKCSLNQACQTIYNKNRVEMVLNTLEAAKENTDIMFETLEIAKESKNKDYTTHNLHKIISKVILIQRMINTTKIIFHTDEELKNYEVEMSPIELYNVLSNHISNSIEAKANIIEIKAGKFKNGFLDLYIIDNGSGIPKDFLPYVYEEKKSTKGNGRGFGMFFCKTILNKYGGDDRIVETDSKGTVILLKIPAKKVNNE